MQFFVDVHLEKDEAEKEFLLEEAEEEIEESLKTPESWYFIISR